MATKDRAHVYFEPKRIGRKWVIEVQTFVNEKLTERYTSKGTFPSYAAADAAGGRMAQDISDELRSMPNVSNVDLVATPFKTEGNA